MRLTQMQLVENSKYRDKIAQLKLQRGSSKQLKTVRGRILDRNGRVLAVDEPHFQLHIKYEVSCFMDERVRDAKLLVAADKSDSETALTQTHQTIDDKLADLQQIIEKCAQLKAVEPTQIRGQIEKINDLVWNRRTFQAWRNAFANSEVFKRYDNVISIPFSEAIADFEKNEPNKMQRLRLVTKVDIAEMHESYSLLELKTDDDVFTAQLEFMDIDGVEIRTIAYRIYPYGPVAAQTIGWVGPATQEKDKMLFADDNLAKYLEDEVCGKRPGVEYVCEGILRGRRGEVFYDIDDKRIDRAKMQFGQDVRLTLDIKLQKRIEEYLADHTRNTNFKGPVAAVVLEVASGEILALVSMPVFDLNRTRYDYADFAADPNEPLLNRAICAEYPPGSVIKPVILIAGLETGQITSDEVISCKAQKADQGWPSCWVIKFWRGHDDQWSNYARNAIKGSCNVYFSRLANRIKPSQLQYWLWEFGYGRKILPQPTELAKTMYSRNFRQLPGIISSGRPSEVVLNLEQLPPVNKTERRMFGIGQGNLRITPLQVANAMAVIARGGLYKWPRLFVEEADEVVFDTKSLNISPKTLQVIRDGMSAVVNEEGGTADDVFAYTGFGEEGVKVYGKTGSTQAPAHALFAGFAEDGHGRSISITVVVEGGQHGSSDTGPLARDIIGFCIEAGYIGNITR